MQEHQLSQFRPNESQRSRNVPDVLFVDEEGNPIEAGEENLIFVDEAGVEMTEEKAIKLIESGEFIDSRVLYDDELGPVVNRSNSMSNGGSTNSFSSNAFMHRSNSMTAAHKSNSLTHAQMQAVQAQQIAQHQAQLNAAPLTPKSERDMTSLVEQQAKVFAQAHAKAREQADNLAQIEADAATNFTTYAELNSKDLQSNNSELQKTRSDRRLPVRPSKKTESYAEETYELDKIIKEQEQQLRQSGSFHNALEPAEKNQHHRSSSFQSRQRNQEEIIMKQERAMHEEKEREYLKEQLLKKQQELMEQHFLEKKQQEEIVLQNQAAAEKEAREEHRRQKRERKERREIEKRQLKEQQERFQQEQERLQREQEKVLKEQQRLQRKERKREEKRLQQEQAIREQELEQQKEEEYRRRLNQYTQKKTVNKNEAPTLSDISKTSTITKISQKTSASSFIPNKRNETPLDLNDMSSNYKSYKTSTTSTATGSRRQSKTRASLEHYAKDYDVSQVKQVGYLTGNNVIRDLSNINLDQFKEFYEDGEQLEFEPHNLDTQSTQFIDPFSADLFKDEMVDIDFGAIDAFTEALNQQILAEKNGVEPAKDLQFPSHVIASNHASFLDNQLLLGDSSPNVEERSGVNVQFITPNLRKQCQNMFAAPTKSSEPQQQQTQSRNESMLEKAARAEYQRNQSFGSVIDVQSMNSKVFEHNPKPKPQYQPSQKSQTNSHNSFMNNLRRNVSQKSLIR